MIASYLQCCTADTHWLKKADSEATLLHLSSSLKQEEQMLQRSILAIKGLPHSQLPYIINHDEQLSCFMFSRYSVRLSEHQGHSSLNPALEFNRVQYHAKFETNLFTGAPTQDNIKRYCTKIRQ